MENFKKPSLLRDVPTTAIDRTEPIMVAEGLIPNTTYELILPSDRAQYNAYRATGLTPEEVAACHAEAIGSREIIKTSVEENSSLRSRVNALQAKLDEAREVAQQILRNRDNRYWTDTHVLDAAMDHLLRIAEGGKPNE